MSQDVGQKDCQVPSTLRTGVKARAGGQSVFSEEAGPGPDTVGLVLGCLGENLFQRCFRGACNTRVLAFGLSPASAADIS